MAGPEENTSFGFRMSTTGGLVLTQAAKVYAMERAGEEKARRSEMATRPWGDTICSRARKVATIQGRILRELDMTNETEAEAEKAVTRVALEMVKADYTRGMMSEAVTRAGHTAWVKMKSVKEILKHWTDDEIESWRAAWDEEQRVKQRCERLEIACDRMKATDEEGARECMCEFAWERLPAKSLE